MLARALAASGSTTRARPSPHLNRARVVDARRWGDAASHTRAMAFAGYAAEQQRRARYRSRARRARFYVLGCLSVRLRGRAFSCLRPVALASRPYPY